MATAKLVWKNSDLVQIKLKNANGEVALNRSYQISSVPDIFTILDSDGDEYEAASFSEIDSDYSIKFDGIEYRFGDVGRPRQSPLTRESSGNGAELPKFFAGLTFAPADSEESASPLPFVNRDAECEQLANILLSNYQKRKGRARASGIQSQHRLTLATSAQMFGSGKSTFAEKFLDRLKSLDQLLQRLRTRYRDSSVQWILGLELVVVDFRDLNTYYPFVQSIRFAVAQGLVSKSSSSLKNPESILAQLPELTKRMKSWEIVRMFEKESRKRFFIHLDEVNALEPFFRNGEDEIALLYTMWQEISAIHNFSDSEIFCTGRYPSLFLLGKGCLSMRRNLRSPEDAECILLDPLSKQNVKEIFDSLGGVEDDFVRRLHDITSGVPRFIEHAVNFFTNRLSYEQIGLDYGKRRKDFLHDWVPFSQHLNDNANQEMNPLHRMEKDTRDLYLELIRIAAFRLPVRLFKKIDGKFWGLQGEVMTLEVCSAFPLYVQRWDTEQHILIVPPIVLSTIAKSVTNPRLPFWASMQGACPVQARAQNSGDVLEVMIQHIICLHVSEELLCGPPPLGQCLPFLKQSIINDDTFSFVDFKAFPKITRTPAAGKSVDTLRKFFDNPAAAGFKDVNPEDLPKVISLLENGVFYIPQSMSSSAGILFITDNRVIVEMQFKHGKQKVNAAMMAKELEKSCSLCCMERSVVFVMIGLTTIEEELPEGKVIEDSVGNRIALCYDKTTAFADVRVPSNLQVVVVLARGLETFLTKESVRTLQKDELDLTDLVLATRSPSKRWRERS